jgi:hypothetical protein
MNANSDWRVAMNMALLRSCVAAREAGAKIEQEEDEDE